MRGLERLGAESIRQRVDEFSKIESLNVGKLIARFGNRLRRLRERYFAYPRDEEKRLAVREHDSSYLTL